MQLVEKHIIKNNHIYYSECDRMCFLSKNLYNSALYEIRQSYFENKTYLNYYKINRKFIDTNQPDYVALPRKISNQTLMLVDKNFKSFFTLLNKKKNNKYDKICKIPKYLPKSGKYVTIFEGGSISNKNQNKFGYVKLSGCEIKLQTRKNNINQIRIVPRNGYYVIEVIYTITEEKLKENNNRYCSIDLGINNLATITSNVIAPIIVNGKPLKSVNQYYNKRRGILQSKLKNNKKTSKRINNLTFKRNNKIKDYLHKSSRFIVNHLVSNNINTLVIGYNQRWKQDINIGKVNNQNFTGVPFLDFIRMVEYKCKLVGINTIIHEESYTSKCSFFDNEKISKHEVYLGKRIKRGLFRTNNGILVNSDVNGSLNILKKVVPNAFVYGIEGLSVNPIVYTIKNN